MDGAIIKHLILLVLVSNLAMGVTRRVPADYATIQMAIDASMDGDVVLVGPGTYAGEGNRDIDFKGKSITVKSEDGPESCIIQCGGRRRSGSRSNPIEPEYHRGFHFHTNEDANSIVQGFTVTQGYMGPYDGGAFLCIESSPIIMDCIIVGNSADRGGGIYAFRSDIRVENCLIRENTAHYISKDSEGGGISVSRGNTQLKNCLVVGNAASGLGGGIYCADGDHQIINCTVTGNRTGEGGIGGGILFGPDGDDMSYLHNSIVWGNRADRDGNDIGLRGIPIIGTMRAHISNSLIGKDPNDIYDRSALISGEWLRTDPMFARNGHWDPNGSEAPRSNDNPIWVDGDYHLESQAGRWNPNNQSWVQDDVTSPCIDAGDPNSPIGQEPFPNGGITNMGAYGGTAEASKSYFGEPVCETIVAGDINGDCKVDFADFTLMAGHWLEDGCP
jgi:hypothetical protein